MASEFDPSPDDLRGQAARATGITVLAQVATVVIQLIGITVLARFLAPSDFGLFAMIAIFTNLLSVLNTGGLSVATIHQPNITQTQVSNLFWLNVGFGAVITLLMLSISPVIASIYGDPRLLPMAAAMSLVFFVSGIAVQADALLRRRMLFRRRAIVNLSSLCVGTLVSVLAALAGAGYWALVLGPLTSAMARTTLVWLLSGWRPSFYRRGGGVRSMVGLGMQVTGADILGLISTNAVPFVLGVIAGPATLGLYNRSNALIAIPATQVIPPIAAVAQPALARLNSDQAAFRDAILSLLGKIALATSFTTAALFATTEWFVLVLLGPGWDEAVPYMRLLSLFILVLPLASIMAVAMTARGEGRLLLKSRVVTVVSVALAIGAGSPWGPIGIVTAVAVSGLLLRMPVFIWFAARALPVSQNDIYRTICPALLVAVLTTLLAFAVRKSLGDVSALPGLVVTVSLAAVFFIAASALSRSMRGHLVGSYRLGLAAIGR